MNDCMNADVRDALPDLLNGRLSELDKATLTAHVESCADCRAELELMRQVRASSPLVPHIDAERIASTIAPYGGAVATPAPVERRASVLSIAWKFAAVAAVVAGGAWGLSRGTSNTASRSVAAVPSSIAVAPAVVEPAPKGATPAATQHVAPEKEVASLSLVGGLDDLSDADIQQLLSDLNDIQTVPSAEPQSVTPSLDEAGAPQ